MCLSQLGAEQAGSAQLAVQSLGTTNEYAARVCSRIFWNSQVLANSSALLFSLTVYTPEDTLPHGLVARAKVACEARLKWKL